MDIPQRWVWKADRVFLLATQVSQSFSDMAAFHRQQAADKHFKEEVDFPDAADLESAREFCVVAKQMVTERIAGA
jgi:hypothetical protein